MYHLSRNARLAGLLVSLAGTTTLPTLAANQVVVNMNLKNTTGKPVYGYGFVLKNVAPNQITGLASNVFADPQTSAGVNNTVVIFFPASPPPGGALIPLAPGAIANFTMTVAGTNTLNVSVPSWLDANFNMSAPAPAPGFKFNADPQFSLTDDPDENISFDVANITFQDNVPGVPVSSLNPGTPSGSVLPGQETALTPGFSVSQTVLPLAPLNYLYVSGDITDPATDNVTGTFVFGVQASVPEASPALLLGLALPLCLLASRRRRAD